MERQRQPDVYLNIAANGRGQFVQGARQCSGYIAQSSDFDERFCLGC